MDNRSEANLKNVHPALVTLVRAVSSFYEKNAVGGVGFIITCGARTMAEQKRLLAAGATRTLNSRHLIAPNGFSHAVDFAMTVNGKIKWDWPLYSANASVVKMVASKLKQPITWGGDWKNFKDGPHFELPWGKYPGTKGT